MTDETIFTAALDIDDPAARAAYLDRACGGNPALRADVDALLAAHSASNLLDRPPGNVALTGAYVAPHTAPDEAVGTVLAGRYKLLEAIGAGGMGAVYMAQQIEPVKRLVAVKVIRAGQDSRQVLARFEAERQALALMDHPNIAKVLDAGTTEQGRPFFVMELVRGVPITAFCDERRLSPRERLELFVPVCAAIQHAHQKGIIHRDIKPGNVLVALYDGHPVPKVIDFGVAKAAGQPLTDRTLVTGFGAIVGTPEYMSPEQAELNQLDIDTRSDVFALGVLLYELLTGTTPLDRERLGRAALLEILRVVREEEPPKPSTRVSTSGALASIAANRGTDPVKLSRLIRGELDWIVMRALEKDRNRRYESATALAKDVERHLRGDAVEACPPTLAYRLRKVYRRHRVSVLAAGAFAALLLVGLLATSYGFYWAEQERERANEAERSAVENALRATDAAETAAEQRGTALRAKSETAQALRRSEGLRLATTALLKKAQSHDLTAALAHEAVELSPDPATVGTALVALEGLPNPRAFAPATVGASNGTGEARRFVPSEWFWYHPDGRRVFVLSSDRKALVTFDAATCLPVAGYSFWTENRPVLEHMTLEPRGRWFVTADVEGGLAAHSADTGAEVGRTKWTGGVWALQFSTTGDRLAVIGRAGPHETVGDKVATHRVAVYALPGLERLFEFEAPELFRAVALSRDGGKVAVSSAERERVIRSWDVGTRAALLEARVSDRLPWPNLVFSHDGSKLIDVTRDGMVAWDLATKEKRLIARGDKVRLLNGGTVSTDAGGAVLLLHPTRIRRTLNSSHSVGDPAPTRLFDLQTLTWKATLENDDGYHIGRCQLSADGRRAVGRVNIQGMVVWDAVTGRRLSPERRPGDWFEELAVSPDGTAAVTTGGAEHLRRWDFADRGLLPSVGLPSSKFHALVTGDGTRVVALRDDGRLETFDAATLRTASLGPPKRFSVSMDGETIARVLADGKRVLAVKARTSEGVLYSADGAVVARYPNLPTVDVWNEARPTVLTAPRGGARFLLPVAKGTGVSFRVYDAETGAAVSAIDLGEEVVGGGRYALSADGRRLAVVSDRVNRARHWDTGPEIWNLDTGARERKLTLDKPDEDGGQAFDPSGDRLVTWRGGRVVIWDAVNGTRLREFELNPHRLLAATLSADGTLLATCSETELALWRVATGANVYRVPCPSDPRTGLAFVAGRGFVVDARRRDRETLDLYPTDLGAHLRASGVRRLTDRERGEYAPFTSNGNRP